jgi:thiosulfate reductase/polysulfide reductase chain A
MKPDPGKQETPTGLSRRGFLTLCAGAGAGAAMPWRSFQAAGREPKVPAHSWSRGEVIPTTCNMCVNRCGIKCHVVDGVLEKIDGDSRNPKTAGGTCAKGQAGVMALYDPDRITHPLIRVGERGAGKWRRASWEEAFEYTADKIDRIIEKYGPEGLLFSSCTDLTEVFFIKFGKYLGTPNFARHATLCLASRNVGYFATMGSVPDSDLANAKYILMFGANRMEAFELPHNRDLITGLQNGARLVVVDPRMTVTASKGEWLPIRPRTDMALTLALMHVLIKEELYDKAFVDNLTTGFDELKAHVARYTPEWAQQETEIPARTIVKMARDMAAVAPAVVVYPGRRSSWYTNDAQFRRTLPMLMALLGAFDTRGASFFNAGKVKPGSFDWELEPVEVAPRFDGFDEERFPLAHHGDGGYINLRDTILNNTGSYPVKGWMLYKQNPLAAVADSAKTLRMMEAMDFICAIDVQPSQTAWMADIILPETLYLERLDPVWTPAGTTRYVGIRQPVVKPQGEAKTLLEILQGLGAALDKRREFETPFADVFNFTMEDYVDAQLKNLPIDRATLMKDGIWVPPGQELKLGEYRSGNKEFKTPSGKIEFVSERFRRNGYDPLPVYEPVVEEPGKQRLVTGRYAIFTHASNQNNVWLNAIHPENEVWINPDLAREKHIEDGEYVKVRSPVGEVRIMAYVTPRIRKDTVFITHGFGTNSAGQTTLYGKGGADQALMQDRADTISNNQALHETFVEIVKL